MQRATQAFVAGVVVALLVTLPGAAEISGAQQSCSFAFGFAGLKAQLGDWMGDPSSCEFPDPAGTGDIQQQTTRGLGFWRKSTNTATFTDGFDHWAISSTGLINWTGSSIDPTVDARPVQDNACVAAATCSPTHVFTGPANPTVVPDAPATPSGTVIHYVPGSPVTFATHTELQGYGYAFGPSDGQFGAIHAGGRQYTFYGSAGAGSACRGTPNAKGAFTFTGTLDHVIGSSCTRLFGPGDGPGGWVFNADYAGGGQVVRFVDGGRSGWLMPFHAEVWWRNPATADHKCNNVNCFYSSLGLAVSLDDGKTFKVVGQILQPSEPKSVFTGGGRNMAVGYGSLVVANARGEHLDNPPADPGSAYFYLFYTDLATGSPGVCATRICMGVARAGYTDVVTAALSGDPHQVAKLFHKYDAASPNPWTQPATSDTPDESGTAGRYAPLWTDEPGGAEVIYDSSFDVYLTAYQSGEGIKVRASSDLIHWSAPIGAAYDEAGRTLYYPTLMGETGDPTIAGPTPRVYFSSFPNGFFPDYRTAVFESVQLTLSRDP